MLQLIKKKIKKTANHFGFRIIRTDNQQFFNFQSLIYYYLAQYGRIKFVQVGGCDGISFDPLYPLIKSRPSAFEGIILEPIQDYYEKLRERYRNHSGIQPLRYAIHNSLNETVLYRPDPDILHKLPEYAIGCVSFERSHLNKFNIPPEHIVEEKVPCKTLEDVMKEYELANPDLLLTDTEGYDADILMNLDFDRIRPSIIHFEHGIREKIMSRKQLNQIFERFHKYEYELIFEYFDAVAIQREFLLSITR